MNISDKMDIIIEQAKLHIYEFDIHKRFFFEERNRKFPFYVLSYMKEGSSKVSLNGKDYQGGEHSIYLIPPNVLHDHVKDNDDLTVFMWWHFNFLLADSIDILKMFNLPVHFNMPKYHLKFENLFSEYVELSHQKNKIYGIIRRRSKALELMSVIIEAAMNNIGEQNLNINYCSDFTSILTDIISEPEENITLTELADEYHMHPTYISNRFKKLFGVSPIQLRNEIRIKKSKNLLITANKKIGEIAYELGFNDSDHLTHYFKKQTGMSPSEFRKLNLKEISI